MPVEILFRLFRNVHHHRNDYTDGTTDVPVEGGYGPNYGSATMTLEQMIKQYTGPDGGFLSRNGSPYMAVVDGPFITARTTPDGYPAALLTVHLGHRCDAGDINSNTNVDMTEAERKSTSHGQARALERSHSP